MPYNNTAIPPSEDVSGVAILPLTRVKRIIQSDLEVDKCSNNAAFVIAVAAEMFVRHLAEQGYNVAKLERKPRKNVQYKDLATAVSRIDNLEFLTDVIPRTIPYKQYKEKKTAEAAEEGALDSFLDDSLIQKKDVAANASFDATKEDMEQSTSLPEVDTEAARSTAIDLSVRGPRLNGSKGDDRQVLNGHVSDDEMH